MSNKNNNYDVTSLTSLEKLETVIIPSELSKIFCIKRDCKNSPFLYSFDRKTIKPLTGSLLLKQIFILGVHTA